MKKLISLALIILVIDQLTKYFLTGKNIILIKGVLALDYVENTGAAFGLFKGARIFFIIITFAVIFLILYYHKKDKQYWLPLGLILGGALGNLLDRIFLGYVRDFVNFQFWHVFNIADSANVIGAVILIYILTRKKS